MLHWAAPSLADTYTSVGFHFHGFYWRVTQVKREEYYFGGRGQIKKYAHFIALSHPFTASDVATVFRMGMVFFVNCELQEFIFLSKFWMELMTKMGTMNLPQ